MDDDIVGPCATAPSPREAGPTLERAVALHREGLLAAAAALYAEVLALDPENVDALHLLGVTETQCGRTARGAELIERALAIKPDQPLAHANRANALLALARPAEALASYDRALELLPQYPHALFGRGNALSALGNLEEAVSSFERALLLRPDLLEALLARGDALLKLSRHPEARASFERAIELAPSLARAHLGRGAALLALRAHEQAAACIEHALEIEPAYAEAFVQKGHLCGALGQTGAAIAAYDQALELDPNLREALLSRGIALSLDARFSEAVVSFKRLLTLDPDHPYARGACLHSQLQICDWTDYDPAVREIATRMGRAEGVDFPFSFLAVCDSPSLQLKCARTFVALERARPRALWAGEPYAHERVRVAYISADFLEHPTSYLLAGVFEKHDKRRFETTAISLRHDERSPTGRRLKAAFERFIIAGAVPDHELARLIRDLEIDIAVDLMGYTAEHRAGVFAHRPAPIQVNYLGYPGTSGAAHIDYLIGDEFLIPEKERVCYSEHIAYLPDCFQANDDRRFIDPARPTRSQMGLPESGFVWCSLHSSYKLNPPLFDIWTRLLHAVPGGVLWLVGRDGPIRENLRREARNRGVDPERLVFAGSLPYPKHLARLNLADLYLDTLPFNGGTTTSDALWAGVPVLTCAGRSFAARMSGSLLRAIGTPELVTDSLEAYEHRALELARSPERLRELRARVALGRSSPLFDTDRFRRHLEAAFSEMISRHRRGEPASHLKVACVT